ncbi:HAD family phosphatase [Siculibacillus lacustris]|uniref:HAD family phosphatase n=1 Tax=Siculibacillus lacustris TaxID=1549641 RepID=A0A4Q9VIN1_9HYPH|nr:HAD family phosphatase [Siculibacillus lacustris]TBW35112.1 HAD family phosphatase [Siculibacillus lacustris]
MPVVTHVVFDIGNVLVRWDPHILYDRIFGDAADAERFLAEICDAEWNLEQDRGRPMAEGIAERIERFPDWVDEIRAWDERWHEMVPGPIDGMVEILETLRARGVPTWAISNFSSEKFAETLARFPFLTGFRDTVVSAHVGLVKPDPAIYRLFLDRNGLDAADCLFVDDLAANVAGARAVGLNAVLFTSPAAFVADLAAHGVALA